MSSSLTISFEVRATMKQEVFILDKNVCADDLIAGLEDGTYFTTISAEDRNLQFIKDIDGNQIAQILLQYPEAAELTEFQQDE